MDFSTPDRLRQRGLRLRRRFLLRRRWWAALAVAATVYFGVQAARPAPPQTTAVWVSAVELQPGEVVSRSAIEQRDFLPGSVPADAIDDPREVIGHPAAVSLSPGDVVSGSSVLSPRWRSGQGTGSIVPVRLTDPGVVQLLRVGDVVDLISADVSATAGETRAVATDVRVAAIPRATPTQTGKDIPGRLVLMQVDPEKVAIVTQSAAREFLSVAWTR